MTSKGAFEVITVGSTGPSLETRKTVLREIREIMKTNKVAARKTIETAVRVIDRESARARTKDGGGRGGEFPRAMLVVVGESEAGTEFEKNVIMTSLETGLEMAEFAEIKWGDGGGQQSTQAGTPPATTTKKKNGIKKIDMTIGVGIGLISAIAIATPLKDSDFEDGQFDKLVDRAVTTTFWVTFHSTPKKPLHETSEKVIESCGSAGLKVEGATAPILTCLGDRTIEINEEIVSKIPDDGNMIKLICDAISAEARDDWTKSFGRISEFVPPSKKKIRINEIGNTKLKKVNETIIFNSLFGIQKDRVEFCFKDISEVSTTRR